MPKLWNETIEAHRHEVRAAIVETTVTLVGRLGLRGVTMSQIAEETGIGRATLYKYFPDVESVLVSWHEELVGAHLAKLAALLHGSGTAKERLATVLEAFATIQHDHPSKELVALLHRGRHVARAEEHLRAMLCDLIVEGSESGDVRSDVPPDELATYCLHALASASTLRSKAAVGRLVAVTLDGLGPPR